MTVEPSYRIKDEWIAGSSECYVQIRDLIPDTRLQAIADAWNSPDDCAAWTNAAKARVRVAHPGVGFLLDALTEDNTDEA